MCAKGHRVKYQVIPPHIRRQILEQYNAAILAGEERKAMIFRLQQEWMEKLKTKRRPFTECGLYRWATPLGIKVMPSIVRKGDNK